MKIFFIINVYYKKNDSKMTYNFIIYILLLNILLFSITVCITTSIKNSHNKKMDSFSDILAWLLAAVVFWAMFNSSSKGKNTNQDDIHLDCCLGCNSHPELNLLCIVCTREEEEKNKKTYPAKKYGKGKIIN
jgi:hypothetical protein